MSITIPKPALRDITSDLKARLSVVLDQRDRLLAEAKILDGDVELLQRMIEREQERHQPAVSEAPHQPKAALPDFVFQAIEAQPMSKEDLRIAVAKAGYSVDGRSIHATVVNLHRGGKIVEINKGLFAASDSDFVKSALKAPAH